MHVDFSSIPGIPGVVELGIGVTAVTVAGKFEDTIKTLYLYVCKYIIYVHT